MDTRLQDNLNGMQHDYMAPFLWLHGEDDQLILNELQRIYDSGIRSVCLESRVHEDFVGEGWWSDVRLIMEECHKKGMKVWILDDKHFPSGHANGAFAKEENAHLRPWGITERHVDIAGPVEEGCVMADAWKWAEEDEMVAVLACKHVPGTETYTQVLDVSEGMQDGMVYFSLPEGMWRIVFLIKTRSGIDAHSLLYCDMLDAASVRVFVDEVYEKHYQKLQEYFGNTFLGFFSDEPGFRNNSKFTFMAEMGKHFTHYAWSDKLMSLLENVLGSDYRTMLPGLWFDVEGGVSERIRYTYMDMISREYSDNFCNQLADWCHAHGVEYIGHVIEDNGAHARTGVGTGHYFRALSGQDMSGIDVVLHQIVPGLTECSNSGSVCYEHMENKFYHYYLAKLGSSLAHMDAKKKGRAMCEIFGAFGWAEGTRFMKYLADHMLVRGINYYVPHAFSPKLNDPDCPPNFYDSGENALYKYFRYIMDYMNRACYLLSDGVHVPAAAILYDAEGHWVNKKKVPLEDVAKELYDHLLDYDIIPADVLDQIDDEGVLNGEKYPCLIVPYYEGMPEIICEKLQNVTVPIIFVTMPGIDVPQELFGKKGPDAERFHAERNCTEGIREYKVLDVSEVAAYVREHVGADVTSDYNDIYLRYYHYVRNGAHIYMFNNEDINHTIRTKVSLSAFEGGDYVLYDAMENKAVAGYSEDGQIEIVLPPYNTMFVMFGDIETETMPRVSYDIADTTVIAPEFRISYAEERAEEYTYYKTTAELFNVTGRNELPSFSGNMKYEGTFEVEYSSEREKPGKGGEEDCAGEGKRPEKYVLDLGKVGEAAEVYVNETFVGCRLIPPYAYDISDAIKAGSNALTVIVSNHSGYKKRDGFSKYLLFEPSGLLGPISLKKFTPAD